jgi:LmbE family N-acetylglucosaminyl deacetylase
MPKNLFEAFFDETLKAAGFAEAPEEFKKGYRERLELAFAKRLGVDAVAMLDPDDIAEFKEMIEQNPDASPQMILEFFQKHIPNFEEKVAMIMKEFQEEFIQAAKAVSV